MASGIFFQFSVRYSCSFKFAGVKCFDESFLILVKCEAMLAI